ncbi:N-acetylneuraminate synthase [Oscillospiraceae bacterium PP1C4]
MKVLVIAEAGVNHNGSMELAQELVLKAALAGADFVKFQTFIPKNLVSTVARKAKYQQENTCGSDSQLEMLQQLVLPQSYHNALIECCRQNEIRFLSTPFDLESIDFLKKFEMPLWKVPSGEITNYPYLVEIAKTGKEIILSTGMSNLEEIRRAVSLLTINGCGKITLLHCNTEYPTPFEDVNLNAMLTLKREFGVDIGYSDHTVGIEVPIAAAAMGATVIEKHFTLDKNMEGPDHKASLEPNELQAMIHAIRNIELAMGDGVKEPSPSEQKNINIARKSIVAKCHIECGETLTIDNITTKRPGNGVSSMLWPKVLGTKAIKDFDEDELIEL